MTPDVGARGGEGVVHLGVDVALLPWRLRLRRAGTRARRALRRSRARAGRLDDQPVRARPWARAALTALTALYVVTLSRLTVRDHEGFGTHGFDLGIFDQGVWLLSRFDTPFVTVRGLHLLGDHTSLLLPALAPLYWLVPSASVLLVVQSAALGLGAVPVFLLARHVLRSEWAATACATAYLVHPAVAWTNLEDFHPESLQVPLVLLAVHAAVTARWRWFLGCTALLLLSKEDAALLTGALGLYVAARHHRRVGLAAAAVSAVWLAVVLVVLLPAFNGVGSLYTGRVTDQFGGGAGLVRTTLTSPGEVVAVALSGDRAWYLWQLLASTALLSLLAPPVLLVAAGPLATNLLSSFGYQHDIRYHYATLIVPVLVASAVLGIARFRSRRTREALACGMLLAALIGAVLWGPFGRHPSVLTEPGSPVAQSARAALALVPAGAAVSAAPRFVPHLTHREQVYEFPNPWRATNWGRGETEGAVLRASEDVAYVLVSPADLREDESQVLSHLERSAFHRVHDAEGVVLLVREPTTDQGG